MRNVSVADARAEVDRAGRDCRRATGAGDGGRRPGAGARARRAREARPSTSIRSARNTIRLELKARRRRVGAAPVVAKPAPWRLRTPATVPGRPMPHGRLHRQPRARRPRRPVKSSELGSGREPATTARRSSSASSPARPPARRPSRSSATAGSTPAGVTESKDRPRRLVLDFPNVTSKAPTQTAIDSPFVSRVRVALNSHQPLVTRVVMEIASRRRYHVERSGEDGRDLAVVFEQAHAAADTSVTLPPAEPASAPVEAGAADDAGAGDRQRRGDHASRQPQASHARARRRRSRPRASRSSARRRRRR